MIWITDTTDNQKHNDDRAILTRDLNRSSMKKTSATDTFQADADFVERLPELRQARRERKITGRNRRTLSRADRDMVLAKTGGRCHICGDSIKGDKWEADHLLAHSFGGPPSPDNCLPAHPSCNRYRWVYTPEEFLGNLRLGVWLSTHMARKTKLGKIAAEAFRKHDCVRELRRKKRTIEIAATATAGGRL
jgi:5-methylcytosine-specific restriction endonuclease McrA